jgi:hypothetical protein
MDDGSGALERAVARFVVGVASKHLDAASSEDALIKGQLAARNGTG